MLSDRLLRDRLLSDNAGERHACPQNGPLTWLMMALFHMFNVIWATQLDQLESNLNLRRVDALRPGQ
eukprot:407067-Rhodomonas_salina.1